MEERRAGYFAIGDSHRANTHTSVGLQMGAYFVGSFVFVRFVLSSLFGGSVVEGSCEGMRQLATWN